MAGLEWDASDFLSMLAGVDAGVAERSLPALLKAAEHVRGVSVGLAPIETGDLRGKAAVKPDGESAEIYYPGPYARNQHYSLDFRHTEGQALYLEQPMLTEKDAVMKIIADELGGAF
ncbi:hypothetical protein [Subtercola vilae]|uniref:HK97 gp10 family phage protein n=1 Tax=Subtercola vilae TaxID=2056433 RepID=A0A4T2BR21_9MICO|nr:hypothetical protein [Subtercola vilae]TIH33680.1 hypothetical protein D4765_14450 [Subtercola vilae]